MTTWRWGRAALTALGLIGLSTGGAPCFGQEARGAADARGEPALARSLEMTKAGGRPTVVVVTADLDPGSHEMLGALVAILRTHPLGDSWQVNQVTARFDPALVKRLGVTSFPTVMVYRRGKDGLELAAHKSGETDAYVLFGWLRTLISKDAAPTATDPAIVRTSHVHSSGQQPTPQAPAPAPPPVSQAPVPQPVYQAPAPQPAYQPIYQAPAPQPVVVSAPTAPVVFQPPTQTIVMAPQPPPNIVFAAPAPQPAVSYAPSFAPAPAPAMPVLLAPAPSQPAQAPAPTQPVAMAPPQPVAMAPVQPVMMAPSQPVAMAPAQPVAAAPANVGQGPIATTVLTTIAPSLLENLIGTIGEHFARKRQPRIQMAPAPAAQQFAQAPVALGPAGLAPAANVIPVTYVPAPPAQPSYVAYPAAPAPGPEYAAVPYYPPSAPPPPPYPTPSPQGAAPTYHGYGPGAPPKAGHLHFHRGKH